MGRRRLSILFVLTIFFLTHATSASAQAPPSATPERPARAQVEELAFPEVVLGQSLVAGAVTLTLCSLSCDGGGDEKLGKVLLSGLAGAGLAAAITSAIFWDGLPHAQAQAINGGTLWIGYSLGAVAELFRSEEEEGEALGPLLIFPLGAALGALYYELARPTSGQVSAVNSFGFMSFMAFNIGSEELAHTPLLIPLVLNGGLALGGLVSHLKPLSRGDVWICDLIAYAADLIWMNLAPTDDGGLATGPGLLAAHVITFGISYLLLPEQKLADEEPSGLNISLVPGDALFHAPGEVQGGAGVMLGFEW